MLFPNSRKAYIAGEYVVIRIRSHLAAAHHREYGRVQVGEHAFRPLELISSAIDVHHHIFAAHLFKRGLYRIKLQFCLSHMLIIPDK